MGVVLIKLFPILMEEKSPPLFHYILIPLFGGISLFWTRHFRLTRLLAGRRTSSAGGQPSTTIHRLSATLEETHRQTKATTSQNNAQTPSANGRTQIKMPHRF